MKHKKVNSSNNIMMVKKKSEVELKGAVKGGGY